MSVLAAKKLNEALAKAKNIGLVEESFILEDCEITLRNLRPDEYITALAACQEFDDVKYLHAYQTEHLARAIIVLNGMDLRNVKYIEDVEPNPKDPENPRTVKVELSSYLLKNVISTWSKEAVYTAYRKFSDVVDKAERKAKEGVQFLLPDETNEEKYRRLLLEAKECEGDLPGSLIDSILEEHGLMRKSTAEEVKAAMEHTDRLAREKEAQENAEKEAAVINSGQEAIKEKEAPEVETKVEETAVVKKDEILAAARQPLNRASRELPADPHKTLQHAIEERRKASVQQLEAPKVITEAPKVTSARAAQIAALEHDAGTPVVESGEIPVYSSEQPTEVVELRKQDPIDPKKVSEILDRPPAAGINPRFRPPPKL